MKTYQSDIQDISKKIEKLQREQASLEGEVRQLEQQLATFGITDKKNIPEWLEKNKKALDKAEETLDALLEEIEEKLNEFEN